MTPIRSGPSKRRRDGDLLEAQPVGRYVGGIEAGPGSHKPAGEEEAAPNPTQAAAPPGSEAVGDECEGGERVGNDDPQVDEVQQG